MTPQIAQHSIIHPSDHFLSARHKLGPPISCDKVLDLMASALNVIFCSHRLNMNKFSWHCHLYIYFFFPRESSVKIESEQSRKVRNKNLQHFYALMQHTKSSVVPQREEDIKNNCILWHITRDLCFLLSTRWTKLLPLFVVAVMDFRCCDVYVKDEAAFLPCLMLIILMCARVVKKNENKYFVLVARCVFISIDMNADIVKCERMQDFLDGFFVFTATRAYGFETIKMFYFLCLISGPRDCSFRGHAINRAVFICLN